MLEPLVVRTLWISDVHLGTRGCSAKSLLTFLERVTCETLYLVGDIIDCWHLEHRWYWPDDHHAVACALLKRAKMGTRVVCLAGNHDAPLRQFVGYHFGQIHIADRVMHTTFDGKKLLVLHGDHFDVVCTTMVWLARLGDVAYTCALAVNRALAILGRQAGIPPTRRSLSAFLKHKVKRLVQRLSHFEARITAESRRVGADGVVCGHVHHAEIRTIEGTLYCNDGDWVESCTALVEDTSGELRLIRWGDFRNDRS